MKLSPEVAWYLQDRGYAPPDCPPLIKTPEPREVPGARFDPARVDKVIAAFRQLRHTKGRFAGQRFDPDVWQVAYMIAPVAGWVHRSPDSGRWVRIITILYVDVPRKNGKGIGVDTPILTGRGWIKFGDLRVGDLVHTVDGSLTPVTFVSDEHQRPCYEVEFGDGQVVVCDDQHLWTVWDRFGHDPQRWTEGRGKGAAVTIDTPTLYAQHRCGARGDARYSVRADRVLRRPASDLPVDPYLLGAWLGDGATDAARITTVDAEVLAHFGEHYDVRTPPGSITHSINGGFRVALRALGVLGNKHVPDAYLTGSAEQRMELLRGLMDTDGGVNQGRNTPRVEFTSTRRELADAALFLARSLGWKATIREGRAAFEGRDCGPKWRVTWTAYRERSPFALARKTDRLAIAPERATRAVTNAIVAVRPTDSVRTRCIQVADASKQFLIGEGLVPTHNTTTAAGWGIYLTAADGEFGAQVVAAATTKEQAGFVFEPIRQLVNKSPGLKRHLRALKHRITHAASGSYFQPIANAGDAQHGADVHGAIVDELHLHKQMDLIEALETGTGSREQPLIIYITTADAGKRHTPYDEKRSLIEKLARDVLKRPTTYGVVFAAEKPEYLDGKLVKGDDPFAELTWRKANPGYGVSPTKRSMVEAAEKAKDSPAELASFLRLRLGIRTKQETRYLDVDEWDMNASIVDLSRLKGRECWGGLDLGSTSDLCALAWVFSAEGGAFDVLLRCWAPEDSIEALDARTADAASGWVEKGWLTATPGDVTDYDFIKAQIGRDRDEFLVQEIAYDRWNATQIVNDLTTDGAPMITFGQGFASMSAPTKDLQRLIKVGARADERGAPVKPMIRHGGNPLWRWMVDNFAVTMDPAGNVKPDKKNAGDKIDGVVALIMALARAVAAREAESTSAYEDDDGEGLMIV
ncbi:terminase TerL endonuclease subunit [Mycobacterium sp. TY815]|uniref:terminase TerL endonuclease subunit n=1 Tax=Mycobacterium sp. TY815 TaxID=3050581 RepID=UPI0027412717|nr:terminase TerL endonuclease subunit [Mycobacterium sp. TY815]MDP7706811.1 terminase large subunit [Mycobacterium sp. TY815]